MTMKAALIILTMTGANPAADPSMVARSIYQAPPPVAAAQGGGASQARMVLAPVVTLVKSMRVCRKLQTSTIKDLVVLGYNRQSQQQAYVLCKKLV